MSKVKAEHSNQVDLLTGQLQQSSEERAELEENRAEAQRRIEGFKNDFRSVLITKDSEIEELVQKNTELENDVTQSAAELHTVSEKLKDAEEQVTALQSDLSRELNTHTNELESFERLNEKLNTTSTQLQEVETVRRDLETTVDTLNTANKNKQNEIDSLTHTKCSLEEKYQKFEQSYEQKIGKLAELSHALEQKDQDIKDNTSLRQALEASVSLLERDNQSLTSDRDNLKQVVEQKEDERKSLTAQISKLVLDLEVLQSSHLDTGNSANAKQILYESVKLELEKLQTKHSELESSLDKNKISLAEAKKQETLAKKKLISMKQDLTSSFENKMKKINESVEALTQTNQGLQSQLSAVTAELEEQSLNQISVYTGDNCYHLYVARLAYDPAIHNDSIDSLSSSPAKSCDRSGADSALSATERIPDISVNPGDYVFVSGGLTEEGYYEGHLLDGRAGLIPSNVLEPLYEFDIYGFVIASEPLENLDESGKDMSEFSSTMFNDSNVLPSTPRPISPFPRNLTLDQQLSNGILVGWDAPEGECWQKYMLYLLTISTFYLVGRLVSDLCTSISLVFGMDRNISVEHILLTYKN